jgi:hypothetical protein
MTSDRIEDVRRTLDRQSRAQLVTGGETCNEPCGAVSQTLGRPTFPLTAPPDCVRTAGFPQFSGVFASG